MGVTIRVELLGRFRLSLGAATLARLETAQTTELLAYLAAHPDAPHRREALCDLLWPEADLAAARHRLTQALSSIRKLFDQAPTGGPALLVDRSTAQLDSRWVSSDVHEFRRLLGLAKKETRIERKIDRLNYATARYRGEFLPESSSDWAVQLRWELAEDYGFALRELAAAYEDVGDLDGAVACLARLVDAEPLDEEIYCDLIETLIRDRRYTSALRQYATLEQVLQEQLGTEPSEKAQGLARKAKELAARARPGDSRPIPAAPEAPATSPAPLNRCFGREAEVQQALWVLGTGSRRLITFTGPGGTGKTRLALEVGRRAEAENGARVVFVDLGEANDESLVFDLILGALHLRRNANVPRADQVVSHLSAGRPTWLILDNFDYAVEAAKDVVRPLLDRLPQLRIAITSRIRLNLEGEMEVPVPPLPVPDHPLPPEELYRYPSVQLFVDRAQALKPDFRITPQNAADVGTLCQGLEGIPLAVELAAAWIHTLTPAEMVKGLANRFSLLVSRRADVERRHRTLRSAIEYSYLQLDPSLRHLLSRLAVFRGSWTAEAACAVGDVGDPALRLAMLHERSLILAEEDANATRYRMLDTIREYAWEQLDDEEQDRISRAHAEHFADFAAASMPALVSSEQEYWLDRLDKELPNLVGALSWCLRSRQADLGLKIASSLAPYWELREMFSEGRQWLRAFLDLVAEPAGAKALRAKALLGNGKLAWFQASYDEASQAHHEALALAAELADPFLKAEALYNLGINAMRQARIDEAERYLEESLAVATASGDKLGIARAHLNLGNIAHERNEHEKAMTFYEVSRALAHELGNKEREAFALNNLAIGSTRQGNLQLAEMYLRESVRIGRLLASQLTKSLTLNIACNLRIAQGKHAEAYALSTYAFRHFWNGGNRYYAQGNLMSLARIALLCGQRESAGKLLGGIVRLGKEIGAPLPPAYRRTYDQLFGELLQAVGPAELEAQMTAGQITPVEELAEFALQPENILSPEILRRTPNPQTGFEDSLSLNL